MWLGPEAAQGGVGRPDKGHVLPVLHGCGGLAPEQLVTHVLGLGVIVDGGDDNRSVPTGLLPPDKSWQLLPVVPGGKQERFGGSLQRPPGIPVLPSSSLERLGWKGP